jgi:hypothetical protein
MAVTQVVAQTATLLPNAKQTFLGTTGAPLAAGTVTLYTPNSTNKKTTWVDPNQVSANTNPINLDAAGRAIIFGQGNYRQVVKDVNGVTIWDAFTSAVGSASPSGSTGTDTAPVGTVLPYSGFAIPTNWQLAYGQPLNRVTFASLLTAITISNTAVSCTATSTTLTGFASTAQFSAGEPIEATCLPANTTIASITNSTTIVVSAAAISSAALTAVVFPWGNGDGNSTFNVPDLRGRVFAGADAMGGTAANLLTASYYGASAAAPGISGGSQSHTLLQAELPAFKPAITITDPGHTHPIGGGGNSGGGLSTAISGTISQTNNTGTSTTGITAALTSNLGSGTALAIIQPTLTVNYIIKVAPNASGAGGVVSIGGMFGDIICDATFLCTNQTIGLATQLTGTILANIGASTMTPTAVTLSNIMDDTCGSSQGDIFYRGPSTWNCLPPGTAGFALLTQGGGTSPLWGPTATSDSTAVKAPAQIATTGSNITLSGEQTIDGVLTNFSRVVVKDQSISSQNGIYNTSPGTWNRSTDANTTGQLVTGTQVFVTSGTVNGQKFFAVTSTNPIFIGTSSINLVLYTGNVISNGGTAGQIALFNDPQHIYGVTALTTVLNTQLGTTYTVQSTDQNSTIAFSNSSPFAIALPQAGGLFPTGWAITLFNIGTSNATITPATSTINGLTSLILQPSDSVTLISDGTNYKGIISPGYLSTINAVGGRLVVSSGSNTASPTYTTAGTGVITAISNNVNTTGGIATYPINISAPINAQTGTTYTVLSTDNGKLVTFTNASPIAITLPAATGSFGSGFATTLFCLSTSTGSCTITAGAAVNNNTTIVLQPGDSIYVESNGSIYVGTVSLGYMQQIAGNSTRILTAPATNGISPSYFTAATGVQTALGVSIGSAGSFVVNGGALGTPSSGTGTNITGISASNVTSGSLPVAQLGASAASHASLIDVGGTATWKVIPDCLDSGGNHLNYTQSTDAYSCGTSGNSGLVVGTTAITSGVIGGFLYQTSGNVLGNSAAASSASLIFNQNAAASPTVLGSFGALTLITADAQNTGLIINGFGTSNGVTLNIAKANGTGASPTALGSGNIISDILSWGYNGASYIDTIKIECSSTEAWSVGHNGTKCVWATTPNGSASLVTAITLGQDQSLTVVGPVVSPTGTFTTAVTSPTLTLGTISSATGTLKLANASSANLTTIQAGNAAAARTYTWPTDFGAAGTVLTDAAGNGTLSWAAGGSGITALTGDVTASGTGSVAANVAKIAGVAVGTPTGTGNVAFSASPTFTGTANFAALTASGVITSGAGGVSAPGIAVGASNYGLYQATNQLGFTIAGTKRLDYGITQSAIWTFNNASGVEITANGVSTGNLIQLIPNASNGGVVSIFSSYSVTEGPLALGTYSNYTTQLVLNPNGTVSIGAGNLLIAGSNQLNIAAMTNAATTSSVCYNTGTGAVTYDGTLGTCTVSDERLKNMGERIPNALDRLLQINGVYYTWKDPSMGAGRQIGVGAQTVEAVFPELVQTDSNGRKSADYQRLTAPIIEALRELKANNDNLQNEIESIKKAVR